MSGAAQPTFDPDSFMQSRGPAPAPFDPDSFMQGRKPAPPPPSALSRFGSGLYDSTIGPIAQAVSHPIDTAVGALKTAIGTDDLSAIAEAIHKGDFKAAGTLLAKYGTEGPAGRLAHPMVDPVVQDVQQGDYASAAGRGIGTAAMLAGPEILPKAAGAVADAARGTTASRLVEAGKAGATGAAEAAIKKIPGVKAALDSWKATAPDAVPPAGPPLVTLPPEAFGPPPAPAPAAPPVPPRVFAPVKTIGDMMLEEMAARKAAAPPPVAAPPAPAPVATAPPPPAPAGAPVEAAAPVQAPAVPPDIALRLADEMRRSGTASADQIVQPPAPPGPNIAQQLAEEMIRSGTVGPESQAVMLPNGQPAVQIPGKAAAATPEAYQGAARGVRSDRASGLASVLKAHGMTASDAALLAPGDLDTLAKVAGVDVPKTAAARAKLIKNVGDLMKEARQ